MPKTDLTPQFTSVSAITSVVVRSCARLGLEPNEDLAVANVDREQLLARILVATGRCPGQRIEIPAVPGTTDPALAVHPFLDRPFAQGAALVRAAIVHRRPLPVEVHEAERGGPRGHRLDPPLRQVLDAADLDPIEVLRCGALGHGAFQFLRHAFAGSLEARRSPGSQQPHGRA